MLNAIVAAVLVSLCSLVGLLLLYKRKALTATYGGMLVSMAAGVMLATAVLDLLPEAVEAYHEKEVFWALLAGICLFFIMERLVHWYHHHHHEHGHDEIKPAALLILMGDSLHNFFDGIAIATAFSVDFNLGVATTLAILLHEIPQELADFVALLHSGMKFGRVVVYNLLTALTAVLGAMAGWYFIGAVDGVLPFLLAFNAGMFIYISCSDLIPALHEDFKKDKKWLQTVMFLLGVMLMAVLVNFLHAEHGEEKLPGRVYPVESHLEAE